MEDEDFLLGIKPSAAPGSLAMPEQKVPNRTIISDAFPRFSSRGCSGGVCRTLGSRRMATAVVPEETPRLGGAIGRTEGYPTS